MSRMLAALAAVVALAVPTAANAQTVPEAADAPRALTATAATCAWDTIKPCPARRTKLFSFWGKLAEATDDTKSLELDLQGAGHAGNVQKALARRFGETVDVRWTALTKFTKINFDGKRSKITSTNLLEVLEDNPRATLYVDGRMWPTSVWDDDEPILRAVRVVVDLSDLPAPAAGQGLTVQYFANKDLTGAPFATGVDQTIDFDWVGAGPAQLAGRIDAFGVKWTGSLIAPIAGTYNFRTTTDDGVVLVIDGVPVITNWVDHSATNNDVAVALAAGSHTIEYRFYENTGVATARLSWQTPGSPGYLIVPAASLRTV